MHSALFTAALLLAPLVSASMVQHAAHQGLAARIPRAKLHRARDNPYQGPRHAQVARLKRRAVEKRAAEATLKCLTRYTFALCDGDNCTNMGSVALGTACVNNEIVFDDTYGQGSTATDVPANMANLHSKSCDDDDMGDGKGKPTHTGTKGTIVAVVPTTTTTTTTTTKHGPSKMHRHPTKAATKATTKAAGALVAVTPSSAAPTTTSSDPTMTSSQATPTSTSSSSIAVVEAAYVATSPAVVVAAVQVTSAAAPTATSAANGPFSDGFATFFFQEGGYGACGKVHADSDKIVAIQIDRYGTGSNNAPDCGRTVSITNQQNGKTVLAIVADACPGCKNYDSLDLSTGAFDAIADEASGIIPITWYFVD